jgi:hypothetical protein
MLMFIHLHGVAGVGGICLGPMTLTPLDRASQGRGVQSQNVGCRNAVRCRIVPDAPESRASAPSAVRRFSTGAIECEKAIAFHLLLAMNCQVAAGAVDGAEAPYFGAPAVRESGAVMPTNVLGLLPGTRRPTPGGALLVLGRGWPCKRTRRDLSNLRNASRPGIGFPGVLA